jgi:hypothetical protein
MPRPSKGARLYFREREAIWYIKDGERERSTRCGHADRAGAEKALQAYLAEKHEPDFGVGDPLRVSVCDVLLLYGKERGPDTRRPDVIASALPHLAGYFDRTMVGELTPGTTRAYVGWRTAQPQARFKDPATAPRVGDQTARRELEVLSAAIGYAFKERKLRYPVPITLPTSARPVSAG